LSLIAGELGLCGDVVDMDSPSINHRSAGCLVAINCNLSSDWPCCWQLPINSDSPKEVTIDAVNDSIVCVAQPSGAFSYRV
jgi:hypothetical protein